MGGALEIEGVFWNFTSHNGFLLTFSSETSRDTAGTGENILAESLRKFLNFFLNSAFWCTLYF